jgi:hypothetical protein
MLRGRLQTEVQCIVPVVTKAPVPEDLPPRALLVRNHLQSIRHGPCWRCAELDLYLSQAGMAAAASDSSWGFRSITVLCHRVLDRCQYSATTATTPTRMTTYNSAAQTTPP